MRFFKAKKATVEAGSIHVLPGKHHQTNTHNAKAYVAKKDVRVRVDEQYETRDGNAERPPSGSVITGRKAVISSRNKDYLGPADEPMRMRGIFRRDVTVRIGEESDGRGSLKKRRRKE
ncbi:MAG: hypothetical protein LKJ94_05695 [Candidatus Methanomethylophilus sp.]|jgi:hypothetical protein|nr:hypothetical protein [Methanomethylophilus sp.]MCI2092515.1 hypothetical protein [Methanomethylophilus sp.]